MSISTIPTPIECSVADGVIMPGFSKRALILTEDWVLDGWELFANPSQPQAMLELQVRVGGYGEFPDKMRTIARPYIYEGNKNSWSEGNRNPLGIHLPTGTILGVWTMLCNTDYFLLNLQRRAATQPQIVRLQPPSRVPLPGEGETQSC